MAQISSGVVRVATLNLWVRHGVWDERRLVLVEGLRELEPEIIAFQEAVMTHGYDQVADLLGASFHVAHQGGREADDTGLSIANCWEVGEVWEPEEGYAPAARPRLFGRFTTPLGA